MIIINWFCDNEVDKRLNKSWYSIIELLYKPIQYYFHERIWCRWIKLGLKPKNNYL
jgi:hypothetical protein